MLRGNSPPEEAIAEACFRYLVAVFFWHHQLNWALLVFVPYDLGGVWFVVLPSNACSSKI